ncbi:MAG: hypothetical protein ACKOCM_02925 [Cyanobacteriota bacterium]
MLEAEDLFSLDALLWLQSGKRAGQLLGANQSTISRRSRQCLERLGLSLEHCAPCPPHDPMQALLLMERQLHQLHRLRGGAPLRLLANFWVRRHLLPCLPPGWMTPDPDPVRPHADPLGLLEARIVDAALLSGPEVRDLDRRRWRVVDLSALPLQILVPSGHRLARERGLGPADLAILDPLTFSVIVPQPVRQAMAVLHGHLGARTALATVSPVPAPDPPCMATAFTRHLWPGYVPLDVTLPIRASDHLVVLAELPWEARLDHLLEHFRLQLQQLRAAAPELVCLCR